MKKRIIAVALMITMLLTITGCSAYEGSKNYESNTGLMAIPGAKDLYYDTQTKIVYFVFSEAIGYQGYGYMSAYYAPNGLPYQYDPFNQELIEITPYQEALWGKENINLQRCLTGFGMQFQTVAGAAKTETTVTNAKRFANIGSRSSHQKRKGGIADALTTKENDL